MTRRQGADFLSTQHRHFEAADAEHFAWVTRAPGFAETEDELLAPLLAELASPCLEIGCGEGGNLARLQRAVQCVGVDLHPARAAFAAQHVSGARCAAADAAALPFADAAFASIFVRDLLHHVPDPARCMAEAVRVLAPGGRLWVVEPNGRNPFVALQSRLIPAEAEAGRSGVESLERALAELPLDGLEIRMAQPLPLRRALLHYRFGVPRLGRSALARRALGGLEQALGGLLPGSRWSYLIAGARRSA